jgi:hypothetical protein
MEGQRRAHAALVGERNGRPVFCSPEGGARLSGRARRYGFATTIRELSSRGRNAKSPTPVRCFGVPSGKSALPRPGARQIGHIQRGRFLGRKSRERLQLLPPSGLLLRLNHSPTLPSNLRLSYSFLWCEAPDLTHTTSRRPLRISVLSRPTFIEAEPQLRIYGIWYICRRFRERECTLVNCTRPRIGRYLARVQWQLASGSYR